MVVMLHPPEPQLSFNRGESAHEKTLTGFSWLPQVRSPAWKVSETTK